MAVYSHRGKNALLDDYAKIAARRGNGLVNSALRTRSHSYLEILAYLASHGELTFAQIKDGLAPQKWAPRWRLDLIRAYALLECSQEAYSWAASKYEIIVDEEAGDLPPVHQSLLSDIYAFLRRGSDLEKMVTRFPHLSKGPLDYRRADLFNIEDSEIGTGSRWWGHMRGEFDKIGLPFPNLASDADKRFLGLELDLPKRNVAHDPLVTTVVTTYRPNREGLLHSVNSLLNQTWSNLEVVVVDDASGGEYDQLFEELADLDSRVRVVRLDTNGGTYGARNVGFAASRGEFITGQDADDWAHPERIERQMIPLLEDSAIPGTITYSLKLQPDLRITRVGRPAFDLSQPTLLIRRTVRETFGDYLPSRKAADTEYYLRINRFSAKPIMVLEEPLEFMLMDDNSLSGAEFRPGWRHPARDLFRESYGEWHEAASSSADPISYLKTSQPIIPARYQIRPSDSRCFDVIFAADWQSWGGPQRSILEEIAAHRAAGRTVGILDITPARMMKNARSGLNSTILKMAREGYFEVVLADDEVETDVLILRYPPTLQFPADGGYRLKAKQAAILANQAPSERDGRDIRYYPKSIHKNFLESFGIEPLWIPQGPVVREQLDGEVPERWLCETDFPSVIDVDLWRTERREFRSTVPVIGRHSRDDAMKWPGEPADILNVYPDSPNYDVRVMGGSESACKVLGYVPVSWLDLPKDYVDPREFLAALDFYVFFSHNDSYEAFGLAILEALATGCVTILPRRFEQTFGDAAIYCEPSQVRSIIERLYANPEKYQAQSELALRRVAERYSHAAYLQRFTDTFGVDT